MISCRVTGSKIAKNLAQVRRKFFLSPVKLTFLSGAEKEFPRGLVPPHESDPSTSSG
jgi:hypothetical protein